MENHGQKELIEKAVSPPQRRPLVVWLIDQLGWSKAGRVSFWASHDPRCGTRLGRITTSPSSLNVIDDFTREALAVEIDLNLPASRVIRTLERVAAWQRLPIQASAGQRPGVRRTGPRRVSRAKRYSLGFYRARPPYAERLHRAVQWKLPPRCAGHARPSKLISGGRANRAMAGRLQAGVPPPMTALAASRPPSSGSNTTRRPRVMGGN